MERIPTIDELKSKHAALETKLDAEVQRPLPDPVRITSLKREKLRIKDQIASLERA